jgi:hypothetical protein
MEALYAIALLCQVFSTSPFNSMKEVDKYQHSCQKGYIECYESKIGTPPSSDPLVWQGKLKQCVQERQVK